MTPRKKIQSSEFGKIELKLASPNRIEEWSHGEVTKPETINYRTQRSEKNGLFDERIFGPERDFECYCGKYRGIRYRGIECEKCGVEVTRSIVRRERMGHISLCTPVSHIWFLRNIPSRMALILGVSAPDLERVVYFTSYIITDISEEERERLLKDLESEYKTKTKELKDDKSKTKVKEAYTRAKRDIKNIDKYMIIDDVTYARYAEKYGGLFEAETGAEAIYNIFKDVDLKKLEKEVLELLAENKSATRKKLRRRLSLIRSMMRSGVRPEWMFLTVIPVIPAALRPMVALEGGRHATSDINDLYRRVINRNNRLRKLLEIGAPSVILRNEKRILQEAVDALIDNSMRQTSGTYAAVSQGSRRPLKSLSDNLRGKQGLFRANLLGKRVDYSGRSVIVIGPDLRLDQCGLPKQMALELFRPFVIAKLLERELAYNVRGAGRLIEEATPEVWAILEEVIENKYVLLNRAPTLHRLGIQAFKPILVEGYAIQIHPLVVSAFNADFDGDQMAVHVPLSEEAQKEARMIMAANRNLLRPGNGTPIISVAHQDIVLGCYWTTKIIDGKKGEGMIFESPNGAILAYDYNQLNIRARIKVRPTDTKKYKAFKGEIFETSVGRLLFNSALPSDYPFINEAIDKKQIAIILGNLIKLYDTERLTRVLDDIKNFGFKYSTRSGVTFGYSDVSVPKQKKEMLSKAGEEARVVDTQFDEGLLTSDERFRMHTEIWHGLRTDMEKVIEDTLDDNSSINDMWKSGARGSLSQITNMTGLKGLIAGSTGRTIEFPILSSIAEGFTPIEYFINTHSSRKGLGDTALNTAQSGYLTRRLFDVGQDITVSEDDCKTKEGVLIRTENLGGIEIPISKNIIGRVLGSVVKDTKDNILFRRGQYITEEDAAVIEEAGVEEVLVRSPMTCESVHGVCIQCYGRDLGTGKMVELGEAVGTVAAQSIGEPATQLTMRTFHHGGRASRGGDIVQGLPRVEEIFERRPPKTPAVISTVDGVVLDVKTNDDGRLIEVLPNPESAPKTKKKKGETESIVFEFPHIRTSLVKKGDNIVRGQLITDGSADLTKLFKLAGSERTQEYIISEVSRIYELQGASVARKHIELIIRQMFSRYKVTDPGDTILSAGDVIERHEFIEENEKVSKTKQAEAEQVVLGIARVALSRKSFLSAASFQNTNKILIEAAVRGRQDELRGLKENVIIGRLIPAGSGMENTAKAELVKEDIEEYEEE